MPLRLDDRERAMPGKPAPLRRRRYAAPAGRACTVRLSSRCLVSCDGRSRMAVRFIPCAHSSSRSGARRAGELAASSRSSARARPRRGARSSERVGRHAHPAFHQHARAAAHDRLGHGPLAVDLFASAPTRQGARGVAETHRQCGCRRRRRGSRACRGGRRRADRVPPPCPSSRGAACPWRARGRAGRRHSPRSLCRWSDVVPRARDVRILACAGASALPPASGSGPLRSAPASAIFSISRVPLRRC